MQFCRSARDSHIVPTPEEIINFVILGYHFTEKITSSEPAGRTAKVSNIQQEFPWKLGCYLETHWRSDSLELFLWHPGGTRIIRIA